MLCLVLSISLLSSVINFQKGMQLMELNFQLCEIVRLWLLPLMRKISTKLLSKRIWKCMHYQIYFIFGFLITSFGVKWICLCKMEEKHLICKMPGPIYQWKPQWMIDSVLCSRNKLRCKIWWRKFFFQAFKEFCQLSEALLIFRKLLVVLF